MGSAIEIVGLNLQKWECAQRPILMSALQLHADQCLLLLSYFIICSAAWRRFRQYHYIMWHHWSKSTETNVIKPAGTFMFDNVNKTIPTTASATDGNRNHNVGAPDRYCIFFCNLSNIYWLFIAYKWHQRLKEEAVTRDASASWAWGTFLYFILFDHLQINRSLVRLPLHDPS